MTPGPQGPTGPSGPIGAAGPVGPTGPAGAGNLTACSEVEGFILASSASTDVAATGAYDKSVSIALESSLSGICVVLINGTGIVYSLFFLKRGFQPQ